MPRVSTSPFVMQQRGEDKNSIALKYNIGKHMEIKGLSDTVMGGRMGMGTGVFGQKRNHPQRFTFPELIRVFHILEFSNEEIFEVLKE